ncbi:MAG: hypothetical protein COA58_15105 [Bacteroidetes bacterium]|nr:MAG: hypothetical protein COA58_15105 [Bacteroidota bacterium]
MNTLLRQAKVDELIICLEKIAPKSCSKPKTEMCSKCVARISSDRAMQIQVHLKELRDLQQNGDILTTKLENSILELLDSK